jgi:predicted aspartyl protease
MGVCRLSHRKLISARINGATGSTIETEGSKDSIRVRLRLRLGGVVVISIATFFVPALGVAKQTPVALPGYKAVRIHYGALNRMLVPITIEGQAANLIVDTGARQIVLDADSAASFGISPARNRMRYIGSTEFNGQLAPLAFARNLTVGSMNFGGTDVALLNSGGGSSFATGSRAREAHIVGILGTDLLTRYKAVINCGTRLIFFKVDPSRQLRLGRVALSQHFTRVPMARQANGSFTVSCSINGHPGTLLVDTGALVTTLDEAATRSFGVALHPTKATAHFPTGVERKISLGEVNHLMIGDFKVPPTRVATAALPGFARNQGNSKIDGILGLELLVFCHSIIDFDSMSLFLK